MKYYEDKTSKETAILKNGKLINAKNELICKCDQRTERGKSFLNSFYNKLTEDQFYNRLMEAKN